MADNKTLWTWGNQQKYHTEIKEELDKKTVYTHPTTSGNNHIPSGGSSGKILRWTSDGTAYWGNETTYSTFVGSGVNAKSGLVPKPPTTEGTAKYLREDGTWAEADEELNSMSKNPIQNRVVYGLKAMLENHEHKATDIYDIGYSGNEIVKAVAWVIDLDETPEYVKESVAKANEIHYVSGRIGYTVGTESAKIELGFVPTAIWVSNISTDKNVINISRTNDVNTYFTVPAEVSGLVTGTLCYVAFK